MRLFVRRNISAYFTVTTTTRQTFLGFRSGFSMAFSSEMKKVLQAAVAGIPRVAKTIADIPTALPQRAFEAVERCY